MLGRFEGAGSGVHVLPPGWLRPLALDRALILVAAVIFQFFAVQYLLAVVILGLIYVLLGRGPNIVVGPPGCSTSATWPSTPLAPMAWRWATSTWPGLLDCPAAGRADRRGGWAILGFRCCMHGDYLAIVTGLRRDHPLRYWNNWLSFHRRAGPACRCRRRPSSAPGVRRRADGGCRSTSSLARLQPQHEVPCSSTWCCSGRCWCSTSSTGWTRMPVGAF